MARCAVSLDILLDQLNTRWPNRPKASDGWIGDAAHASRTSDHNPDVNGVVHARDFTHDPSTLDGNWLAGQLTYYRDPRIKYVIWNHKIWQPAGGWVQYTGTNPHTKHLHLSVHPGQLGDDGKPWQLYNGEDNDMPLTPNDANTVWSAQLWHHYPNTEEGRAVAELLGNKPGDLIEEHTAGEWITALAVRTSQMERKLDQILDKLESLS